MTKRYGARSAVWEVDWSVRAGTVHGLVGPNGAEDHAVADGYGVGVSHVWSDRGRRHRGPARSSAGHTGALIESPGFVPTSLSGRDNLRLLWRMRGGDQAGRRGGPRQSLARSSSRDRYRTYSLGMKQRLGVAAAIMGDPGLLVLDEPSNGLDPDGEEDMHELVLALAGRGVTVIVSSHDLAAIERMSDDVSVMIGGSIVASGSRDELLGNARLRLRSSDDHRASQVVTSSQGSPQRRPASTSAVRSWPSTRPSTWLRTWCRPW